MKKILFLTTMIIGCYALKAQTVNDIPIKDIDVDYMQIVGTAKLFSTKQTVKIDFGQRTKLFSSGKETIVKDENGKVMDFNSMIDALNFMSKNGFEFVHAYAIVINNENVYHYLLKHTRTKTDE